MPLKKSRRPCCVAWLVVVDPKRAEFRAEPRRPLAPLGWTGLSVVWSRSRSEETVGFSAASNPEVVPEEARPYRIQAFPLQIPAETSGSSSPSTADQGNGSTLSRGQIAGTAVGCVVFLGLVAALVFVQIRRRRYKTGQAPNEYDAYRAKPELPASDVPRAELEGHGMYPEMEGELGPGQTPFTEPHLHDILWLAPQTTPFTNRADAETFCRPSVRCEGKTGDVKILTPLSRRPSYVYPGDRGIVTADRYPDCFPDGYYSIGEPGAPYQKRSDTRLSVGGLATDFELAAAYPGMACRAGWHTACSTTFGIGFGEQSQVWCCPSGNYQCGTTHVKYALTPSATMRVCVSMVSVLTFVETAHTNTQENQLATRSTTVPSDQALPYRIQAFPLAIPAMTTGNSPGPDLPEPSTTDTTIATAADEKAESSSLTMGQIAGLVRRQRRRGYAIPELPATDKYKAEGDTPRVELGRFNMYPEVSSEREPVEAPPGETQCTPLIFHKEAADTKEDDSPVLPRWHLG
ncbi:uncharacterized protein PG986_004612 [Apiospora aurea]|uniref:Uncharacterized protein n=1 Tax=Apiospora aurea TaxID=335848 RepID=A0ABR1QN29_9PEZI